ncbi:family 61 glycoside hydrolase [Peziza echinospora]|nr:family 61 glycoside hydrolase [Peziza echinospora]
MKLLAIALVAAAVFTESAQAHYRFLKVIAGSTTYPEYQYIRKNTNANSPVTSVSSNDLRCNEGGLASAATTDVLTVNAGTVFGFEADIVVSHPGPFNIYMAKAPSTVKTYDGSGANWFRVWDKGATITTNAITFDVTSQRWTFTIPKSLPNGEYLVRIEHIALHGASTFGGAQFYISCAQINVQNGGSGNPSPKVSIPGVYTGNESGILLNIYWPIPTSYTVPGPTKWA